MVEAKFPESLPPGQVPSTASTASGWARSVWQRLRRMPGMLRFLIGFLLFNALLLPFWDRIVQWPEWLQFWFYPRVQILLVFVILVVVPALWTGLRRVFGKARRDEAAQPVKQKAEGEERSS